MQQRWGKLIFIQYAFIGLYGIQYMKIILILWILKINKYKKYEKIYTVKDTKKCMAIYINMAFDLKR